MKNTLVTKNLLLAIAVLFAAGRSNAQVANWNFNNTLAGTGSANATAGNAALGSSIASGDYNGGTLYYGEGNWPAGALDPNAYLEFSITPTAGHTLSLSSVIMQLRRSTTGTAAGSGPTQWVLRSNLDGYTADLGSGTLTLNTTPSAIVTLGIDFLNVSTKVVFRLYGTFSVVTAGGLNRFVYDNIAISGSTILPVVIEYFKATASQQTASISWKLAGEGNIDAVNLQRATAETGFSTIKQFSSDMLNTSTIFNYADPMVNASGTYAYRLQLISADGQVSSSAVETVTFEAGHSFQLQAIYNETRVISFRMTAEKAGVYTFNLYDMNGNAIAVKQMQLPAGTQVLSMDNRPLKTGMYILTGENQNQKTVTRAMVL